MARNINYMAPGVVVVLIGLAAVGGSFWIALDYDGSWGPRTFPLLSAVALILLGGLTLLPAGTKAEAENESGGSLLGPFMLLGLTILYLGMIGKLGYLLSTAIVTPSALWLFGIRNPVTLALGSIVAPLVFHVIFFKLLGVFPPHGSWFDLLDVIGG